MRGFHTSQHRVLPTSLLLMASDRRGRQVPSERRQRRMLQIVGLDRPFQYQRTQFTMTIGTGDHIILKHSEHALLHRALHSVGRGDRQSAFSDKEKRLTEQSIVTVATLIIV